MGMIWAQAFPFVALQFFEEGDTISKDTITLFLIGSFSAWFLLNIAFFCIIDISYLGTFFRTQTAPQYTCEWYLTNVEDSKRWDAVFENRLSYSKSIHGDIKVWVAANIDRWKEDRPAWFNIELIPDEFLTEAVIEEGGKNRRRSVNMRIMGGSDKVYIAQ